MSKRFNVNDIINKRKNELDYSPFFQSKFTSITKDESLATPPLKEHDPNASIQESQNAGIPAKQQPSIPESQNAGFAGKPACQQTGKAAFQNARQQEIQLTSMLSY